MAGEVNFFSAAGGVAASILFGVQVPRSGGWVFPYSASSSTVGSVNNELRAGPLFLPRGMNVQALAVYVAGAGTAGAVARAGLYADDGTGRPGALLFDAGPVAATVAATYPSVACNLVLPPGIYWPAAVTQGAPVTNPSIGCSFYSAPLVNDTAIANAVSSDLNGYVMAGVAGALPNPFVISGTTSLAYRVGLQSF